jgi:hypothetical protein
LHLLLLNTVAASSSLLSPPIARKPYTSILTFPEASMLPFVLLATLRTCEPRDRIQGLGRSGSKTSLAEAPDDDQNDTEITIAQAAQSPVLAVHSRESVMKVASWEGKNNRTCTGTVCIMAFLPSTSSSTHSRRGACVEQI